MSAAAELIHELREAGYRLSRRGDKLHVAAPPGSTITDDLKQRLLDRKPELLELLAPTKSLGASARPIVNFRLPCTAPNSWATAIGAPGESIDSLMADLRQRWPEVIIAPVGMKV